MKDVAIAIRIGSPVSELSLVKMTFDSLIRNMGSCDWRAFISIGENVPKDVIEFSVNYQKLFPRHFEVFHFGEVSWAWFINEAIRRSAGYEYFIKAHDDIRLDTPDFYRRVKETLTNIGRKVAWVSFTDVGWRHGEFCPPVRVGYHLDFRTEQAWERGRVFQLHTFPDRWWELTPQEIAHYQAEVAHAAQTGQPQPPFPRPIERIATYTPDVPKRPVIVHAPFNQFTLIPMTVLEELGPCEDWGTKNALLVDEDWGLRALIRNIPNIWLADIEYYHCRDLPTLGGGSRSGPYMMQIGNTVHEMFSSKWNFHNNPTDAELAWIVQNYSGTLVPWSIGRRTYEYDYLD